jgi:AraC-like DNA-binding protein
MDTSTSSLDLTGVVPAVCDAEAGLRRRNHATRSQTGPATSFESSTGSPSEESVFDQTDFLPAKQPVGEHGFSVRKLRSVMTELCAAIRSALDDERGTAEDRLRRASEILADIGESESPKKEQVRGGLSPWQIRKVTSHVEAHLDRPIRNEDLATIVRLNPCHFGRAFRNSLGEPPHEYVIRRRVERAQGLMLSTGAPLSEIALDCGLSDQSHLSRLFRRIVGESPRAWRRARQSSLKNGQVLQATFSAIAEDHITAARSFSPAVTSERRS